MYNFNSVLKGNSTDVVTVHACIFSFVGVIFHMSCSSYVVKPTSGYVSFKEEC